MLPIINKIQSVFTLTAISSAIGLAITIPSSTYLDSILKALVLIGVILGGTLWQQRQLIRQNTVAIVALVLFGLLTIGCFYNTENLYNGLKVLNKYNDLALISLLIPLFYHSKYRQYAWNCFMGTMTLTLILSFLIWFGVFEHTRFFADRAPSNPFVFKRHITHGLLMAFAAYVFIVNALNNTQKWRYFFSILALLATFNVLFMVQGRTGYLVLAGLLLFLSTQLFGRKGSVLAIFGIATLALCGYLFSTTLHNRIVVGTKEFQIWHPNQGHNGSSSMGTRMDFYTTTLKIIAKHPLLGVGTGGFEQAYQQEILGTAMDPTTNPHNQFLLLTAQIGPLGVATFLLLLATQWRLAKQLASKEEYLLARGLVISIALGCLFNSFLLDHAESLFYAWASGLLFAGFKPNAPPIHFSTK